MTNTMTHAKREIDILESTTPDALILEFKNEIIALCEKFGRSGQSGGSAPYVAFALSTSIKKLCLHQTIAPLTGEDSEWTDISGMSDSPKFQNNRDSRVFKDSKNSQAYFIEAIVFDGDTGGSFNGWVNDISSSQIIKSFPFIPKTFRVDVIDHRWKDKEEKIPDIHGDWWTHEFKSESQLREVFEYYNKMPNKALRPDSSGTRDCAR